MINRDAFRLPLGNDTVKETLIGMAQKHAFPHALILSGPEGSGKRTLAESILLSIACENTEKRPCLTCRNCEKIKNKISPDVVYIERVKDRQSIGVEAVRAIREVAYIKPNDLSCKFFVILDAERMTPQAQNALLKLFEEPPAGVYFLLLTTAPTSLLPTVRSRAPELRTELFDHPTLSRLLITHFPLALKKKQEDPMQFERVLHAAGGSYGRACQLLSHKDDKHTARFLIAEKLLSALASTEKSAFLTALLAEATQREHFTELLSLLAFAFRDMTAAKRCQDDVELLFYATFNDAEKAAHSFSLNTLLAFCSRTDELISILSETNVNLRTAAIEAVNVLWACK